MKLIKRLSEGEDITGTFIGWKYFRHDMCETQTFGRSELLIIFNFGKRFDVHLHLRGKRKYIDSEFNKKYFQRS